MNQVAISFGSDNALVVAQWQAMLRGLRGLSAYEVAVKNGFVGTEAEWLESLHGGGFGGSGPAGLSAYQVAVKNGFVGTEAQWLTSLEGRPGADSTVPGPPGLSAYAIAVKNGFVGSESDWEASLIGPPGQDATGGGERSRADRVLQTIIGLAPYTMANNRFKASPLRDAPTMTPITAVESTMTRMYSAKTGGQKPWNIVGGNPTVDTVGTRGVAATYDAATGAKLGIVYWVDKLIDGNECNVVIEQGRQYRLLVQEDGVFKYVPDANVSLTPGTGTQAYRIQFPNHTGPRVRRRFRLESGFDQDKPIPGFQVNNAGRFVSIHVKKQDQIMRPAKPYIRSVHIVDSNGMGVNGPHGSSHSCVMAAHLGIDDHWVAGIHSNGALQSNINSPTWLGRRDDWRGPKPDILFFNLSWVDRKVVQEGGMPLAQAVATIMGEFTLARTEFPQMPVMVLGLLWSLEGYASQPDILAFNQAFEEAIAAKNDPLLIYIGDRYPEAAITGLSRETAEQGVGNADIYYSPNDHYSDPGDGWVGIVEAQTALEKLTDAFYNPPTTESVPRISPTSATVTGAVDQVVDRLVATVSNATPSSVQGNAPAGTEFVIVGKQLRLQGTYSGTTGVGQVFPVVVKTVEGKDLAFTATVTVVAASVASIDPTSGTATGTVGAAMDVLLGKVNGGTPSGVSGTTPAGTEFVMVGQELRLQGRPTEASAANFTATVQTPNGNPTFLMTAAITASSDEQVVADLRFEGAQGSKVIANSATGPGALSFTIPSGGTQIATGIGVKEGVRALQRLDPDFREPGAESAETLTLNGKFFMGGWFTYSGNGCLYSLGSYRGASYLDMEVNGENLQVYRQEGAGGGDMLIEAAMTNFPINTPTYVSLGRDADNTLQLGIGGFLAASRANVTDVFMGRIGILNQPEERGYGLQGGWADLCKIIIGGSGPAFPYTPPTT